MGSNRQPGANCSCKKATASKRAVEVSGENLDHYLGVRKFNFGRAELQNEIGPGNVNVGGVGRGVPQQGGDGDERRADQAGDALHQHRTERFGAVAVAIPAVLAYNIFGRQIGRIEAELEGFARDLRELLANHDGVAR